MAAMASPIIAIVASVASVASLAYALKANIGPVLTGVLAAGLGAVASVAAGFMFHRLQRRKPRVFISYAHADSDFASVIADRLKQMGAEPVIDRLVLRVGDSVQGAVDRMIDSSDYFLFVVSSASKNSNWAQKEVQQALSRGKRVLPVVLDTGSIPKELSGIFYADFTKDKTKGFAELERTVRTGAG